MRRLLLAITLGGMIVTLLAVVVSFGVGPRFLGTPTVAGAALGVAAFCALVVVIYDGL